MRPITEYANTEQRTPCIIAADASGSMSGAPINSLNDGLQTYIRELRADPMAMNRADTALVTFGSTGNGGVDLLQDFATPGELTFPTLTTGPAGTPLGAALTLTLDTLHARKEYYKSNGIDYTRPWVILMTDGVPTDVWDSAAARAHREEEEGKLLLFTIGIGPLVDREKLARIAPPHRPPVSLEAVKFGAFFQWLSRSQRLISRSRTGEQIILPPITDWQTITT